MDRKIRITDIEFESELNDFNEVLDKCHESCIVVATLKQVGDMEKGINELILQTVECEVDFTFGSDAAHFIHFFINPKHEGGIADLKRIRNLWKTALERQTSRLREGKLNDYTFLIDIAHTNESAPSADNENIQTSSLVTTHLLSGQDPFQVCINLDEEMDMAFLFESVSFEIASFNVEELEYEEMLENERNEMYAERDGGIADFGDTEDEFESELEDNDEFIGNDELLEIIDDEEV